MVLMGAWSGSRFLRGLDYVISSKLWSLQILKIGVFVWHCLFVFVTPGLTRELSLALTVCVVCLFVVVVALF